MLTTRRTRLWHIENYYIHAPAELDEPARPDAITVHPPTESTPLSIMYDHGTKPFAFAA